VVGATGLMLQTSSFFGLPANQLVVFQSITNSLEGSQSEAFRHRQPATVACAKRRNTQQGAAAELQKPDCFSQNFSLRRWVGVTSLCLPVNSATGFLSFTSEAQSPHRAHDRDLAPGIAAAWRRNVAIGQFHRDFPKWPVPHGFQDRP
jgi:hypothetical protein